MTHDPMAYTYDADTHCPDCALARFGRDADGWITGTDREGNAVGIVAPWDEWQATFDRCQVLACGTCGAQMDDWHSVECIATGRTICDNTYREELSELVGELVAYADDHRVLVQGFGTEWRVRVEPDYDWSLEHDGDWFGRIEWSDNRRWERDRSVRPDGMDGRARIVARDGNACLWWQPPTDIADGEPIRELERTLREVMEYGAVLVFVERMSDYRDAYGAQMVADYACLGGVTGSGWENDVVGQLCDEMVARWAAEMLDAAQDNDGTEG